MNRRGGRTGDARVAAVVVARADEPDGAALARSYAPLADAIVLAGHDGAALGSLAAALTAARPELRVAIQLDLDPATSAELMAELFSS